MKQLIEGEFVEKLISYPAVYFEDGEFIGVEFPDLPGCFSVGSDIEEARKYAVGALNKYFLWAEEYPHPSQFLKYKDYPDAVKIELVTVDDFADVWHAKLFNSQTQKVVLVPTQKKVLGEKLQEKILKAAGLE